MRKNPARFRLALLIPLGLALAMPSQGRLLPINGTELYVHRVGEEQRPAIVVVHGGPVLEHGYLVEWLSPLADENELVFYDQRLSGRSAATTPPESVTVATFVEDIEALRSELDLGPIHLAAHSWGAHLALRYATRHPDQLLSLILLDPMAGSTALWQQEQGALAASLDPDDVAEIQRLRASEAVAAGDPAAIGALLSATFRTQFHDPGLVDRLDLFVPEDYLARSRRFGAMAPELADFDLHPSLTELDVPTLILYGADEPGTTLGGPALDAALPDSRLVLIEEAGHFPFLEQPGPFLEAVRGFLAEVATR